MTTLSIFTCVIGEPLALSATAESIRPWLSKNLNWIIKFSAQTNVDFINRFSGDYINSYQTVDHSLYDALNQCLQICESDYYMVLGAGDTLLPDGMTAISKKLLQHTPT